MSERKKLEFTVTGEYAPDVSLKKRVYSKTDGPQDKEAYVLDMNFENSKKMEMIYIPDDQIKSQKLKTIPGWCRKDKKRDKQLWGQLKYTCKTAKMYKGDLFEPLPEVKRYVPSSETTESNDSQNQNQDNN